MSSLINMSSDCPSDDLLIVRITGLAAGVGAGFGAAGDGFAVSTAKGFMALKMLDWLGAAAVLRGSDNGAAGVGAGFAVALGRGFADGAFFAIEFFALLAAVAVDFIAVAGLVAPGAALVFFGVVGAVVLATKYSCALKTFKQEPQRTAPLADCSWLGVTRKAVPHLGQRVIIGLLTEVMVYLLLTLGALETPFNLLWMPDSVTSGRRTVNSGDNR
ncbi:MAG: hypothetical protein Q7T48_05095 [Cellvibrio sp.]|nr:hypothetical protein [Cellvibrio sp.]